MTHPLDANGHKKILKGGKAIIGSNHTVEIEGVTHQLTVRPRCGEKVKPYCITHGLKFDSERELKEHCAPKKKNQANPEEHLVAYWCDHEEEAQRGMHPITGQPMVVTGPHGLESDRELDGFSNTGG